MVEKSQYKSLEEWRSSHKYEYDWAYRNGHVHAVCKMYGWKPPRIVKSTNRRKRRPISYWTKERIIDLISQYKKRGDWITHDAGTYRIARENGWLDEIYKLRRWKRNKVSNKISKPKKFWDIKENVLIECREYKVKRFWKKGSPASYKSAYDNGWMDECEITLKESFQKWMDEMYMAL